MGLREISEKGQFFSGRRNHVVRKGTMIYLFMLKMLKKGRYNGIIPMMTGIRKRWRDMIGF